MVEVVVEFYGFKVDEEISYIFFEYCKMYN